MKKIALVIENSREYGRGLVRGIAAFGQERRDWLLRLITPADIEGACSLDGYDGVIARIADTRTCQALARCRKPVVDVFSHFEGTGFVRVETDHTRVGRLAAEYFLTKGYESFAYCGFSGTAYSDTRRDAFVARLAAEPLVRAILCGPLHWPHVSEFAPGVNQYCAGANFKAEAFELTFC